MVVYSAIYLSCDSCGGDAVFRKDEALGRNLCRACLQTWLDDMERSLSTLRKQTNSIVKTIQRIV